MGHPSWLLPIALGIRLYRQLLLQSIEDCRKWVTMWYMCTLSHPPLTSKHKLAKDGQLFKAVNFTLQQATKTKKECKDRYFFLWQWCWIGVDGYRHDPADKPPKIARNQLYRRLGEPQSQSHKQVWRAAENLATDPLTVQPNRRYTYYHSLSITLSKPSGDFVIDASNSCMKVIMTVWWLPESTSSWSQLAWTPVVLFFTRQRKEVPWAEAF
jgi:hypothetical protein